MQSSLALSVEANATARRTCIVFFFFFRRSRSPAKHGLANAEPSELHSILVHDMLFYAAMALLISFASPWANTGPSFTSVSRDASQAAHPPGRHEEVGQATPRGVAPTASHRPHKSPPLLVAKKHRPPRRSTPAYIPSQPTNSQPRRPHRQLTAGQPQPRPPAHPATTPAQKTWATNLQTSAPQPPPRRRA